MTSKDFIIWLKGFTEGVHEFNITPKQWETLKEQLAKVDDNIIPMGGVIVDHNTFKVNDQGFYQMPSHQYGTSMPPNGIITTTPGTTGHITIAHPSSISYTTGSASWNYTTTNDKTLLNEVDDDEFELGGSE